MAQDQFGNYIADVEPAPAPYPLSRCACRPLDGGGGGGVDEDCTEAELIYDADFFGSVYDAVANGDFIVLVGRNGGIRVSSDGVTWSSDISPTIRDLYGVSYGNGFYLAGGGRASGTSPSIYKSVDGITWVPTEVLGPAGAYINGLDFGNGVHVAVVDRNNGDGEIRNSANGTTWLTTTVIPGQIPYQVAFGGGMFVLVGGEDLIMTSPNGEDWTVRNSGTTGQWFYDVAYGDGVWVVTMDAASDFVEKVLRSTDNGTTWLPVVVPEQMSSVAFGNGLFVMQTDSTNEIYTSPDGLTWTLTDLVGGFSALVRFYKGCTFINTKP